MRVTVIPIVIDALGMISKGLIRGLEELEIEAQAIDYPNYSMIKIGQNTEKSSENLRRLCCYSDSTEKTIN